jgi:hypothetical protein
MVASLFPKILGQTICSRFREVGPSFLVSSVQDDHVLFELLHHLANLFKVLLVEGWLLLLGRALLLRKSVLGKRHRGLERYRHLDLVSEFKKGGRGLTVANFPPVQFHVADLPVLEDVVLCALGRLEVLTLIM